MDTETRWGGALSEKSIYHRCSGYISTLLVVASASSVLLFLDLAGDSLGGTAEAQEAALVKDRSCDMVSLSALAPADTTLISVTRQNGVMPSCKVEGYVTTTNPGPNRVNFALHLPDKSHWNGRYYFANQGGSGGSVPLAAQHPSGNPLTRGFAWAATDKGHSNAGDVGVSGDWEKDPAKRLDNAHRGAHVVTVAAQQMTKAFYGVDAMFRYAGGCSGGGGMGYFSVQNYPHDYDGVLLGGMGLGRPADPARRSQFEHASIVNEEVREPGSWVPRPKVQFVANKVRQACDAMDGAVDGMVSDSRLCRFDFKQLACKSGDGADCLTQPQITTFENLLAKTNLPISTIDNWYFNATPPEEWNDKIGFRAFGYTLVKGWTNSWLQQPHRDLRKQPLTKDEMWTIMLRGADPTDTDTNPYGKIGAWQDFGRAGGKLIYFTGEGDGGVPSAPNEEYFRDTWKQFGRKQTDAFARLYVIPGWDHCGARATVGPADGDDRLLETLMNWVEKGQEPGAVVAGRGAEDKTNFSFWSFEDRLSTPRGSPTGPGQPFSRVAALAGPGRQFLLCPFPEVALFDQRKANVEGAVYDAKNWSCVSRKVQAKALARR